MTLKPWNDTKEMLSSFLCGIKLGMSSIRFADTCEYWKYSAFICIVRSSLKCKRSFAKHYQDHIMCCAFCMVRQLPGS